MYASKYNGCGNDFMIVDFEEGINYPQTAVHLCNTKELDTDGLIVVKQNPLEMLLFNKDGSQAPMCGNGIRCFAKYVRDEQLITSDTFSVQTLAGEMRVEVLQADPFFCKVNIGRPNYENKRFHATDSASYINRTVVIDGKSVTFTSLFMGTIHTVVFVDNAVAMLETNLGEKLCHHRLFQKQTNVNFVQVLNKKELVIRTYERGVGWTLACGTGCCASFVVARDAGLIEDKVHVHLEEGEIIIEGTEEIYMSGQAVYEYRVKMEK